jgi:hypothetical protein
MSSLTTGGLASLAPENLNWQSAKDPYVEDPTPSSLNLRLENPGKAGWLAHVKASWSVDLDATALVCHALCHATNGLGFDYSIADWWDRIRLISGQQSGTMVRAER